MRIECRAPRIPLFALWPIYMGNGWVWGERVDLVMATVAGIPHWHLRLPPKRA